MNNHLSYWALVLSIFTLFIFSGIAVATEEPKFSLLEKDQSFELRLYEPKIIAEVEVDGDMSAASRKGFRQIADFIFGNNTAQSGKSEKISMTAPVGVQQSEKNWRVSFVMPSQYTLETLPKPNNPQILIKQLPAKQFALIRFSGLVDEEKMQAKSAELNQWITMKKLNPVGTPELARYNPPWTLPFLRRNELMVEVE